jgi:PhoPQ-activated pathogenicity-related protein
VIEVKTATRPLAAALWQAANPEARDFRLEAIGPAYRSSTLEPDGSGTYTARVPTPPRGWVAYFVELTFASRGPFPFKFTTEIRVAPDTLPFGPPPEMMSAERETAEISH